MQAPEPVRTGEHPLLRYLRLGINVLPLAVGQKEPYLSLISSWKSLQRERVTETQAFQWLQQGDPRMGIGLVCGRISDLVCLDADLDDFAAWILEHPDHPTLAGCWIVETGSGKAHVWVRSMDVPQVHAWYLRAGGTRCGEVRGEGSYAAAPPSLHPSGGTYRTRRASPEEMEYVADVEKLARDITAAYLEDNPGVQPTPPADRSHRLLEPDKEQQVEIASRVRHAGFSRKITETLLRPGNQTPGEGHWVGAPSHSEIDFGVAIAMIRKGWDRDEAEWVFAGTLVAANCYANSQRRGSRGRAYWITTWTNAEAQVKREKAASLVASGGNFKVTRVLPMGQHEPVFKVGLAFTLPDGSLKAGEVSLTGDQIMSPREWEHACVKTVREVPRWTNGQRGSDFGTFVASVLHMAEETVHVPHGATEPGWRGEKIMRIVGLLSDREPRSRGELGLGWIDDRQVYVRAGPLIDSIHSYDRGFRPHMLMPLLDDMGDVQPMVVALADEPGETVEVLRLRLRPGPGVPARVAWLPDVVDDGS